MASSVTCAWLILLPILLPNSVTSFVKEYNLSDLIAEHWVPPVTSTQRTIPLRPPTTGLHASGICTGSRECVPEYLCANGKITRDGATLIDIRSSDDEDTSCPLLETCCSLYDKVEKPRISSPELPTGCGYRNINGINFQIEHADDNEAQFGEFPWMVGIQQEESMLGMVMSIYKCGGSLITPQVVLTAAHCVADRVASSLKVRAGEWETNIQTEYLPHQERRVQKLIVHKDFNGKNLFNDIALVFLESPFELSSHINTVCLPPADISFDYSSCYVTGWGKDQFMNGEFANILKKIDLPIVPRSLCETNLRNTRLGRFFVLDPSFICAGGEQGKDACTGDGGSPLVCPIDKTGKRFYQAGIVAWGVGCGKENVPGVYVDVARFRGWINENLLAYNGIESVAYFTP